MIINYLTHKQFRIKHLDVKDAIGMHYTSNGIHVIDLPYHSNTKVRLHELGHALNNHIHTANTTYYDIFSFEVEAEVFVYKSISKRLDVNILSKAISNFDNAIDLKVLKVHGLFDMCLRQLDKYKIPLTKDARSHLWCYLRKLYATKKED